MPPTMPRTSPRPAPVLASLLLGLSLACPPAHAQVAGADAPRNRVSQPAPPRNASRLTTGAIEFEPKPLSVETVGLTLRIPLGSTAQTTSIGTRSAVQISPKDTSWIVNIQTPQTVNPAVTTTETAKSIALQVMKAAGEGYNANNPNELIAVNGKVLEDSHDVSVNGQTASRLYIAVPGPDNISTVRGYTVFKPSATQFVTFELICSEALFPKARIAYEAMVATAEYRDPGAIDSERGAAVAAGLKVLDGLDEKALREMVAAQPEHWERLYYPATSGSPKDSLEAGYRRFRLSIGSRESINGDAKGGDEGVIVHLDARFLQDVRPDIGRQESRRIVDSQSVFFMSFDRKEEVWNVRNAVRDGTQMASSSEVGARNGRSMNVQTDVTGQPTKTIKPLFQGDGYISRVESLLMPQILVRAGVESGFAFYAFKSDAGSILLRHDTLEQPADRPGLYKVTTRFADEIDKTTVSLYNEKGVLIRSELPGGLIYEPINFEQLLALWKSKHLTTE